jgi:hypothetical protein
LINVTQPIADDVRPERPVLLYIVSVLLVSSTVSWRSGTYFSGSLDPVVVMKAVLSVAALALAVRSLSGTRAGIPIGPRSVAFVTAFLLATCIGGWAADSTFASLVLAVRIAILAAVMMCLLQAYAVDDVLKAMVRVMAAIAVLGAVSSVAPAFSGSYSDAPARLVTILASGRLAGGIPPLHPNELAFLCGVVVLALVWRVVEGRARHWDWAAIAALMGVIWLTGSRTGLTALTIAMIVMMLQTRAITTPIFLGLVALLPAGVYVIFATNSLTSLFERGGSQNVSTLSSRTIAWDAVLQFNVSAWQQWFGGGLVMKQIPVAGQYWTTQILDSSWISALVQGGIVGVALAALWICTTVVASFCCDRRWRSLWLGLLVFLVSRSFLESGLFDATPDFLLFMMVSLMSEKVSRTVAPPDTAPAPLLADRVPLSG